MKKIAVASLGEGKFKDEVSPVFARSPFFLIATVVSGDLISFQSVKNPAGDIPCSAGAVSAKVLADLGVDCVIAGNFGPKSCGVFSESGVVPYATGGHGCRISEAIERYLAGDLPYYNPFCSESYSSGSGAVSGFYFGKRNINHEKRPHVCSKCHSIIGDNRVRGNKCPNCGHIFL